MRKEQIAIVFGDNAAQFNKDKTYDQVFLKATETYFNDILKVRGHVLLNDIYDHLGIPRTTQGCFSGWIQLPDKEPAKIIFKLFESVDDSSFVILTNIYHRIAHKIDPPCEEEDWDD